MMARTPLWITGLLLAGGALAEPQQQRPLTGSDMGTTPAVTTPLPPATSPFPAQPPGTPAPDGVPARREVGDATHALLRLQAEGTYAAPARSVPGDQASRAYQRYLDSFTHPIPERFDENVKQISQDQGN